MAQLFSKPVFDERDAGKDSRQDGVLSRSENADMEVGSKCPWRIAKRRERCDKAQMRGYGQAIPRASIASRQTVNRIVVPETT